MKAFLGFVLLFWLICGLAGDWMLDGIDNLHWKDVAKGPLTLLEALKEDPVSVPHIG